MKKENFYIATQTMRKLRRGRLIAGKFLSTRLIFFEINKDLDFQILTL